ncbi:repressor [Pseudomonas sp. Leaf127]|uniref:LexA family protein n=1 Tax=Pseudomonas sp. Leaf127 TaxID=1736267 RepID=UPI000702ADDD|nr:S24 family peptidase [Pseudomonas sp. Leaf127]KQQ68256.1 repressor [Pseudomonas sp. Leaf127]
MEAQGISQESMAERLGVTQGAVGHWLNGKREPKLEMINRLLAELGAPALSINLPDTVQAPDAAPLSSQRLYRYPVISWVTAGGWAEAVEPYPPGYSDTYELTDYKAKGPAFWLEVRGDSMTASAGRSIPEGTLILVDSGIQPTPGKLVLAKLPESNEATFKKLVEDSGQLFLKPLNPAYPLITMRQDARLLGTIVRANLKL